MPPETAGALLLWATARLRAAGLPTPDLDARLLLQSAAGLTREALILEPDAKLEPEALTRYLAFLARREDFEPVSRILGEREFYGRSFRVTPATLDPRPDTETLIAAALPLLPPGARILDLGTGTGAIAITLLAERPDVTGVATDLSAEALAVAEVNARRLGVADRLVLLQGSWFSPVSGRFALIASNPPYIPASEIPALAPDVREFDPHLALSGGVDGLEPYRAIAAEAAFSLEPRGHVLLEIGAGQAEDVERIFLARGFHPAGRHRDLGGHERCLAFRV